MTSTLEAIARRAGGLALVLPLVLVPAAFLAAQQPTPAGAAPGEIAGRVASPAGAPLADVAVLALGARRAAVTDEQGRFRLASVPAGEVRLVARRIGLTAETLAVNVPAAGRAAATFTLREAATVIAPMVVSATRELQRRSEGSVAVDALGGAEIRQTRATHPAGLMNRLPGVHVSELAGEGHSMAMRQPITTKPMYLYLEDGIPTRPTGFFNHNALYEVNLPQAGAVEVIKGPGTALYGSDAIGGVVNVLTRPAPASPSLEASLEAGGYGYRRLLASGGTTRGAHGVRVDANVTHGDTWKERAPFDRASATMRWDAVPGASGWTARAVVAGSTIDQRDVPAIPKALFDSAAATNLAPIAYRRARALRLSAAFERDAGASRWSITPFGRVNRMALLPSWQLAYDPQSWDTRNTSLGLLAKYRRDFAPLRARVIVGADADVSPGSFVAREAVVARTGPARVWSSYADGATQYDYAVTYRQLSPYLHAEASPVARLRLDAGLRADFSGYRYDTRLAPLDTGAHRRPADTTVAYAHLSPKLGASLELARGASLFASYRHGFRAPSQGQLFQQNSARNTVGLRPVKMDSYEAGVRGQLGARVVYQLAAYDMTIRDDIITYQTARNTREATNAGRTRHRGVEASSGLALTPALRLDASWSVSTQRYVEWRPSPTIDYGGRAVEQAPRDLGNLLLAWSPHLGAHAPRLAAEWSHTGRYATDPANTRAYAGYDLLALHASATVAGRAELFARLANLTNRRYAELVAYDRFTGDQYTPGAPRTLFLGARYGR